MVRLSIKKSSLKNEYVLSCQELCLTKIISINQELNEFTAFAYWFEQQRFYLIDTQFMICDSRWLQMVIDEFEKKDELVF